MKQLWKTHFAPQILERGIGYAMGGKVKELEKRKNGYSAVVSGSDNYDVDIYLEGKEVVSMACTCPYAEKGLNCKHMAAVCWCIEHNDPSMEEDDQGDGEGLVDLIQGIPEEDLRRFVLELAREDNQIELKLFSRFASNVGRRQVERISAQIASIIEEYSTQGYIEYGDTYAFEIKMEAFVRETVEPMIDKPHYMRAFEVLCDFCLQIDSLDIDDSNGTTSELMAICYELWDEILEQCTEDEEEQMLSALRELKQHLEMDYFQDELEEYLRETFHSKRAIELFLQEIDRELEGLDQSSYQFENKLITKLDLMKEKGCTAQEIINYRSQFRHLTAIRQMEIEEAKEENRLEDAIALCLESRELDKKKQWLCDAYTQSLITLYQKSGQKKQYKKELLGYLFGYFQSNLEYINQAKALLSEAEWKALRQRLLASTTVNGVVFALLEQEGLYVELYQMIVDAQAVSVMLRYETALKEQMPLQVRDFWLNYVKERAKRVDNRSAYQELMQYLKKLRDYPDGERITAEIATEWRVTYKRRSAMLDELKKAGF